ncbi:MAG: STAS domain-containing protein [Clostridiales bacterium]|jgi:stage II sporulation protein AA (anti-sigma F factor antagonist)|nr:STAS domain-containing protein [Clostridiales bacterium]
MAVFINSRADEVNALLKGDIDHHNAPAMREAIDEAVELKRPKVLNIDFSEVTFMDSSGIGLVMGRYRTVNALGGELVIKNLSPQSYKVMRLAGVEKIARLEKIPQEEGKTI